MAKLTPYHETTERPAPLSVIQKLIAEQHPQAEAVFWAGSVSEGLGTQASDLDLVVVYPVLSHAYRAAYLFDGWPIDLFVHDLDTLRYFFEEENAKSGVPGLLMMIANGVLVTPPSDFSNAIKQLAQSILAKGPPIWNQETLDKARFFITDLLDDVCFPRDRMEQLASAMELYEKIVEFYFRAHGKWTASGKCCVRYLNRDNPAWATAFFHSFDEVFQQRITESLVCLTQQLLEPFGGLLWEGYHSAAPQEARKAESLSDEKNIMA